MSGRSLPLLSPHRWRHPLLGALALLAACALHLAASVHIAASDPAFAALQLQLVSLPRLAMALLVGAALGLSGSLLQQITQNRLVSPMTLGAASGAWLGLLLVSLLLPAWAASHGHWAALAGALLSVSLVLLIAGSRGISALPVVLAGMAMNLLLGALALVLLIFNEQETRGLFLWGAGDLSQLDWQWLHWLWPKLLPGLLLCLTAPRLLELLKLGGDGARSRGLNLWPALLMLFLGALWLTATTITAVGLIGFIGLLAPNLARLCGARRAASELRSSALCGALLVLLSDAAAVWLSRALEQVIPTGAVAALIGAPALLWLSSRAGGSSAHQPLAMPHGWARTRPLTWLLAAVLALGAIALGIGASHSGGTWNWAWPDQTLWALRWPRLLSAGVAGVGLAVAGVLLQRVLHNALASPDMLGLSAGATLAVMLSLLLFGQALFWVLAPIAAFIGSTLVLLALLLIGRRRQYAPALMVLVGLGLSALLNTALQLTLSQGSADALALLGWLAGSTYRVSPTQAILLSVAVLLLTGLSLLGARALNLLSAGDGIASGRGLNIAALRLLILLLVTLLCAAVTSCLGPVTFLALLAPHLASTLGARRVEQQLPLAALLGATLMLLADVVGRQLIFPQEIPLGIVASVLSGSYFIALLLWQRLRQGVHA